MWVFEVTEANFYQIHINGDTERDEIYNNLGEDVVTSIYSNRGKGAQLEPGIYYIYIVGFEPGQYELHILEGDFGDKLNKLKYINNGVG